jgi:hypothetical protein
MRFAVAGVLLAGCAVEDPMDPPPPPVPVADGTLGAWTAQAAMPTPRANHCSAFVAGHVVVIGGNYRPQGATDFVVTDEIHAAPIGADGTLGAWILAGRTPSPVTECSAAGDGDRLYVIDGLYDDEADRRAVWSATMEGGGMLSPMTRIGDLPPAREVISSEARVAGGVLHLMDVELPAEDDDTLTLSVATDALAGWSETRWQIGFRGQPQYAFGDRFFYSLGGYSGGTGNPMVTTVHGTPVDEAGVLGEPFETTPLPQPTGFGEAVAVDDWVFVLGGRPQVFGVPAVATIVAASIADDGTLGGWTTLPSLPVARTNHEVILAGDFLVVAGGAVMGPGEGVVWSARVRHAPPE